MSTNAPSPQPPAPTAPTQGRQALDQLSQSLGINALVAIIVAIIAGLTGIIPLLSGNGPIIWKSLLLLFATIVISSLLHSLAAYLEKPPEPVQQALPPELLAALATLGPIINELTDAITNRFAAFPTVAPTSPPTQLPAPAPGAAPSVQGPLVVVHTTQPVAQQSGNAITVPVAQVPPEHPPVPVALADQATATNIPAVKREQ